MRNHPHRSVHGGPHELGQNFLVHRPTIRGIVDLVAATEGSILEIGAGDGALTVPLAALGRDLAAIDIDEHRVRTLRRRLPGVRMEHADALRHPLDRPVVVGNVPYHVTTPILRRMLSRRRWRHGILLTQWEVARKRAGVGGSTMMSAQAAPWFEFALHGRVPARHFRPMPSVTAAS
jgi:23S rRNA (adenine-N6)-dimethyltransferase